jgi:hypothetical protein
VSPLRHRPPLSFEILPCMRLVVVSRLLGLPLAGSTIEYHNGHFGATWAYGQSGFNARVSLARACGSHCFTSGAGLRADIARGEAQVRFADPKRAFTPIVIWFGRCCPIIAFAPPLRLLSSGQTPHEERHRDIW